MSLRCVVQQWRWLSHAGVPGYLHGLSEDKPRRAGRRGLHEDADAGRRDVLIVGAGHNGLVAAIILAMQGLRVKVLEERAIIGGACRTEYPFAKAPGLAHSTGAYLLGVMPPELLKALGLKLKLLRRDPHYFLPTQGDRFLLFGSDAAATQAQFEKFFSKVDWDAHVRLNHELSQLRQDLAPAMLQAPLSVEETAERFIRAQLRRPFVDLCRQPVSDYLARFDFRSELVMAMYATTDAFSGLNGSWNTPGSGANFLFHNMCRLPGGDGTWMVVEGGMGTVTQQLAHIARKHGVSIQTNSAVRALLRSGARIKGVELDTGAELQSKAVVVNADPFRLKQLLPGNFGGGLDEKLKQLHKTGTTLKVNMALTALPEFSCLPELKGQHRGTTHLLPQGENVIKQIAAAFDQAQAGVLPDFPTMEWYIHTLVDPTLQDAAGHHSSALFVQWVPYEIKGSSWEREEDAYVQHLLRIVDSFAPGTSDRVADTFTLTPPKIESHFGITSGHIHHIDNGFAFSDRFPHKLPVEGLFSCSAGTHPAGSVIGAAGHNAAQALLKDLGMPPWSPALVQLQST